TAVGVNVPQMWPASSAAGHHLAVVQAERLTHTPANPAALTLHLNVQGFAARPYLVKVKQPFAVAAPTLMNEIQPREVIEMSILARHHKAGWNHQRRAALRSAVVYIAGSVRSIWINLWLE